MLSLMKGLALSCPKCLAINEKWSKLQFGLRHLIWSSKKLKFHTRANKHQVRPACIGSHAEETVIAKGL